MTDKEKQAVELAHRHYVLEEGLEAVYQLKPTNVAPEGVKTIGLLEVNKDTIPSGVVPLFFGPTKTYQYPTLIIEMTPDEFEQMKRGDDSVRLPPEWELGTIIEKPAHAK